MPTIKFQVSAKLTTIKCSKCKREYIFMVVFRNKEEGNAIWEQERSPYCPLCGFANELGTV